MIEFSDGGWRTSVTDANSKATSYAYDDADRLTSVTDAASQITAYLYDTESNLTRITDALGRQTNFAYDAYGRVTTVTFPSTLTETYVYDSVGNLTSKTDRKSQTITYTYDALNRLTRKQYPDTTGVDYTYDNLSRLTRVADPTGTYDFSYDNLGRLTQTTTAYAFLTSRNFVVSYGYDAASNRTAMTDPESGVSSYAYDSLNRLTTLTPPSAISGPFAFSYDVLSRRTQLARPNGVSTNYAYDSLSRLLSVLHQFGGNTIDGTSYTVDNVGNRTAKTDLPTSTTSNFSYDSIYHLTQVVQNLTTTECYGYDGVGNRLSSLGVSPYAYNSSNQLTSIAGAPPTTFTYDNNGNTLTKTDTNGTTTYAWDYENRLASVTLPDQAVVTFTYDPFGRRIYKSSSSGTSIFAYDGDNFIEKTNSSGAAVARYSQGLRIDEPLALLRSASTSFYQADGLGSVTSLSNSSGANAQTYTYDSFGNLTASAGSLTNSFRYTGREFDTETNLHYCRARSYDQISGRFLSEDPIGFDGGRNFYSYVRNNPTLLIDPRGLAPEQSCECQGNTGGWKAAKKCCKDPGWLPSSVNPNPYGPCDSFTYINAGFMYRHAGDGPWGMTVRSCLLCAYKYGTSAGAAHVLCYAIASSDPGTPSPVPGSGLAATGLGLGQAVGAAVVSGVYQTIQYFKEHGKRPFVCLDGVQ